MSQDTIIPARNQRTLKSPVEYRGVGLHSGKEITVRVKPAVTCAKPLPTCTGLRAKVFVVPVPS